MAINGSAVFRVRPLGSNLNGGGFDSAISGAGTDYSRQNAAQTTGSAGTAAGTTAFSDALGNFPSDCTGNSIWIASGAGFTAGLYFITARSSATAVTLDRSPGTGSAAVWRMGGAWADPRTRFTTSGPIVAGNRCGVWGSGSRFPTSDDYTFTGSALLKQGGTTGNITFFGENGRPQVGCDGMLYQNTCYVIFQGILFSANGASSSGLIVASDDGGTTFCEDCTFDQNGWDIPGIQGRGIALIDSEVVSRVAKRTTNAQPGLDILHFSGLVDTSNIHDCIGPGIFNENNLGVQVLNSIVAKNGAAGMTMGSSPNTGEGNGGWVGNCTFDGNVGSAIAFANAGQLISTAVDNCLITNQATVATYGLDANFGTTLANDRTRAWINYNALYGNANDTARLTLNTGTTTGNITGTNPGYANVALETYRIGTALKSAGFPQANFPNATSGQVGTRSYVSPGAVQRVTPAAAGGGGSLLLMGLG